MGFRRSFSRNPQQDNRAHPKQSQVDQIWFVLHYKLSIFKWWGTSGIICRSPAPLLPSNDPHIYNTHSGKVLWEILTQHSASSVYPDQDFICWSRLTSVVSWSQSVLAASSALSWVTHSAQTGSGSSLPMQISLLNADGGDLSLCPTWSRALSRRQLASVSVCCFCALAILI